MDIRRIEQFESEEHPIPEVPPLPPSFLVEPDTDNRVGVRLRKVAGKKDPLEALAQAALASLEGGGDADLTARATADLAVTGIAAWTKWKSETPTVAEVVQRAGAIDPGQSPQALQGAAQRALTRASLVAQLLEQSAKDRAALRALHPELKEWIGVCGEVDPPRRPVNNPVTMHPQHDLAVPCGNLGSLRIRTAFIGDVAGAKQVVLFMHGLGSRLEEADRVGAHLVDLSDGETAGVAFDFPWSGYSERVPLDVAKAKLPSLDVTQKIDSDFGPFGFLEFLDDFVANLVDALEARVPGLRARLACIAGGSLGGNMALRMALTGLSPWVPPRIAPWSPASVWDPVRGDLFKDQGPNTTYGQATMPEDGASGRKQFFFQNFDKNICGIKPKTAQMWWRDDWKVGQVNMQAAYIAATRVERQEVYDETYRRASWRLAYEQLLFSFRKPSRQGQLARYHLLGKKMKILLLSGQKDDFDFADIYDRTAELAKNLATLGRVGRCYLLHDTGHSIHDERPLLLARELEAFLRTY